MKHGFSSLLHTCPREGGGPILVLLIITKLGSRLRGSRCVFLYDQFFRLFLPQPVCEGGINRVTDFVGDA